MSLNVTKRCITNGINNSMEQEPILNAHNKDEYPPMHTGGTGTPLTYWGVLCFLTALILFAGCASRSKAAKNNGFCPTFLYEGQLVDSNGTSPNISISLMTLLDWKDHRGDKNRH